MGEGATRIGGHWVTPSSNADFRDLIRRFARLVDVCHGVADLHHAPIVPGDQRSTSRTCRLWSRRIAVSQVVLCCRKSMRPRCHRQRTRLLVGQADVIAYSGLTLCSPRRIRSRRRRVDHLGAGTGEIIAKVSQVLRAYQDLLEESAGSDRLNVDETSQQTVYGSGRLSA